jgi:hypothetical protein
MSEAEKGVHPQTERLAPGKPGEGLKPISPGVISQNGFFPIHGNRKLLLATFAGLTLGGVALGGVVWAKRAKKRKETAKTEAAPDKATAAAAKADAAALG